MHVVLHDLASRTHVVGAACADHMRLSEQHCIIPGKYDTHTTCGNYYTGASRRDGGADAGAGRGWFVINDLCAVGRVLANARVLHGFGLHTVHGKLLF